MAKFRSLKISFAILIPEIAFVPFERTEGEMELANAVAAWSDCRMAAGMRLISLLTMLILY